MKQIELHKSADNRVLAGVCGGIGEYLEIDPTIVRFVFVIFALWGGIGLIAYIVLAFIMPESGESSAEAARKLKDQVHAHQVNPRHWQTQPSSVAWLGIILILLGTVWLMSNFGFFPGIAWQDAWPIFLVGLGLWFLLRRVG